MKSLTSVAAKTAMMSMPRPSSKKEEKHMNILKVPGVVKS
jgi:hypothetical protein